MPLWKDAGPGFSNAPVGPPAGTRRTGRRRTPVQRCQYEVLLRLLPDQPDRFPCRGEIGEDRLAHSGRDKLLAERRHRKGGLVERHTVGSGHHRMLSVAQQVPVEQQAKTIVAVATHRHSIGPVGTIGGRYPLEAVDLQLDHVGLAHPA